MKFIISGSSAFIYLIVALWSKPLCVDNDPNITVNTAQSKKQASPEPSQDDPYKMYKISYGSLGQPPHNAIVSLEVFYKKGAGAYGTGFLINKGKPPALPE